MGAAQDSPTPQPDSPAPAQIEQWHVKWYAHDEKMRADMRSVGMSAEAETQALSSDGERLVYDAAGNVVCRVDPTTTFKRGKGHEHVDAARDARASLIAASFDLYAACSEVLQGLDLTGAHGSHWATVLRAAISKARGGVS